MKTVLALIFSFTSLASAQDKAQKAIAPDNEAIQAKRVKSITWDLEKQTLVWTVEDGIAKNGEFTATSQESYAVSPQDQTMTFNGERRGFTQDEAIWLGHLMNILTTYCAESVVWWIDGAGVPLDHPNPTAQPPAKPADHPETPATIKVAYPQPQRVPGAIGLVARNMLY